MIGLILTTVIVCSFVGGYVTAAVIQDKKIKSRSMGFLRIDNSEPDEPTKVFMEFVVNPNELANGEIVLFEIKKENYLAQK